MNDQVWYDNLLKFGKGVATGAGVPTSIQEAKALAAQTLGTIFGLPQAYDTLGQGLGAGVEELQHPIQTGQAVMQAARENPAGAAGMAVGMALSMGIPESEFLRFPHGAPISNVAEALEFGGRALARAEKRPNARVMAERARVHRELEGKLGPLEGTVARNAESPGDFEASAQKLASSDVSTEFLMDHADQLEHAGNKVGADALRRAAQIRGGSEQLHTFYEGPPGGLPGRWFRTREEMGGQMLKKANLPEQLPGPQTQAGNINITEPQLAAAQKTGDIIAHGGARWMKDIRGGWTLVGGKPLAKDFEWIFRRHLGKTLPPGEEQMLETYASPTALMDIGSYEPPKGSNVGRAIEMVAEHGRMPEAKASTIVARKIAQRMKAGEALPEESAWFNLHRMGALGTGPGKMRWVQ